ncbi:hypothetical protein F7725_028428 [Dissostichus mawsoni]|uniref:Uncharacterized protein n=2 Tax=Dissostichus mawsoni TaxID=36200 RepID=A0A7J5XFZ1_DISMA|nr:hypothetical protein F7725_028428 [Dissostichus mawsoni]
MSLPTQVNSSSSQQVPNRGRSPSRRDSNYSIKRKRQCLGSGSCPTTRTIGGIVGDTGSVSENSTHEVEPNLPDGASSLLTENEVAEGSRSPCIPAVCKKEDGSRMSWKNSKAFERAHHNKPDVAQALSFPKGSKERRMHLEHLRNRGNFAHNVEVLNAGVGNLVSRKQPKQDSQAQNFLHCVYCQGLFNKKLLWRHMKICKFKPNVPQKPGKTRVQALSAFAVPPPPGVKIEFWKLLNNMVQDDVYIAVKSDVCIMEYGEHLYHRLGYDVGKHEYIRQKLRELGRLLVCSRKTTPLKTIQDHVKPINFLHVVQAVKHVAGFDSETNTYKCPSLALKIGHSLKKISMLVESRANVQSNYSAAKDARTFRRVYETRWNELISAASREPFRNPNVQQQEVHSKLSADKSPQTWSQLAKVTLTQVILFNRRRAGEVSKMPLSAYLSQNPSDPQEDVNIALRIEIRGKRGRKVPVLLTPAMQQALDLLVGTRQECGVPKENIYLFARPSAFTCYRGSDCLRYFAKACGAKNPESLTSTKLRKQTGTLSQVLNLTNTELDLLADFLGHDIRPFKKKLWEKTEIQAVEKHMMTFINTCRVPRKSDCDKCLEMEGEALKQRNWLAIKFYIKNRITALKSKMTKTGSSLMQLPNAVGVLEKEAQALSSRLPSCCGFQVTNEQYYPEAVEEESLPLELTSLKTSTTDRSSTESTAEDSSDLEEDIPLTPKKAPASLRYPLLSPAKPNCSKKNNRDTPRKRKITSPSPLKKNTNTHNKKSRIDEDSIRVLPPSKISESCRVYNKRNYCLYCFQPTSKIALHLEAVHGNVPDVAIAFQHPKNSIERRKLSSIIRSRGNFAHNANVVREGVESCRPVTDHATVDVPLTLCIVFTVKDYMPKKHCGSIENLPSEKRNW